MWFQLEFCCGIVKTFISEIAQNLEIAALFNKAHFFGLLRSEAYGQY